MKNYAFNACTAAIAIVTGVVGCSTGPAMSPLASQKINDELKDASEKRPVPTAPAAQQGVLQSLLPSLSTELSTPGPEAEYRFDLKVTDAPAAQVLNAIVNDTRYSMVVHPNIRDRISLSLRRVTVLETLKSVHEIYGYEYRIEGNLIYVTPGGLQTRIFKVDYLSSQRSGTSDIRVSSNTVIDPALQQTGGGAGALSSTNMQTNSSNNFWAELRISLAVLAGCSTTDMRSVAPTPAGVPGGAAATPPPALSMTTPPPRR